MLRNAPLRSKLFVTLVGPLLALIILAAVVIHSSLVESSQAARVNERARLAGELAPLVHGLQAERSLSSSYVAGRRRGSPAQLDAQRAEVDRIADTYRAAASRLDLGGDPGLKDRVDYGIRELDKLQLERSAVNTGPITQEKVDPEIHIEEGAVEGETNTAENHGPISSPADAIEQYTDTIADLLDVNTEIAPGSNNEQLLRAVAAAVALARAKEFTDHQRGLVFDVLSRHRFVEGEYGKLTALAGVEVIYTAQFETAATREQLELYEATVRGPAADRVEQLRHEAIESGGNGAVKGDAATWFKAASAKLELLRDVERRLSSDIIATSASVKARADRRALLYSLLLAAALALAIGVSLGTARSLIRRLGRLKDTAHEVAERKLPLVVSRLQNGEAVDLAAEAAAPIQIQSRDEIGQLGEAFNFAHRVAVQLAGREAALRRSVGDMLLNLARRSQSMVERQLELIADLGGRPTSQDVLVELSELDHLAARMRRNADNLVVLSGAESARRWRGPVLVRDVVGAAIDEVREHRRVDLLRIDQAHVAGHASSDVVRLLAELIENALSFSAPETNVLVAGQALPAGYLVEVQDRGIGMSDQQVAEVNQRLAEPEDVDLAHARMLGFFVVGQLASRHGIKVQLRRSWEAGVTVLVLLPADLLVRPEEVSWPDPSGSRAAIPWAPVAQTGLPHKPGSPHRQ
jgi:HAMP domain-containing protein